MHTGVLDQNWIRNFFKSVGNPIGHTSKIYEDNKATNKSFLEDRIAPQARLLDVIITALYGIYLSKHLKR